MGPTIYCWKGWLQRPLPILKVVQARLPEAAVFSGRTAAWVHGIDTSPFDPIEITISEPYSSASRGWLAIRRTPLPEDERAVQRELRITSRVRTVIDLARYQPLIDGVAGVDMALHGGVVTQAALSDWASAHAACHRSRRLHRVLQLAEPRTESPAETRLRLVLILGGLPRPQAQVPLHDRNGDLLGRADLYYPDQRLVIEFDGRTHRESLVDDDRRQNRLVVGSPMPT